VLWLEDYLLKWPRTVLLVSHAREFLNSVCTDIIHLHSRTLTCYRGTYNNFVKTLNEVCPCSYTCRLSGMLPILPATNSASSACSAQEGSLWLTATAACGRRWGLPWLPEVACTAMSMAALLHAALSVRATPRAHAAARPGRQAVCLLEIQSGKRCERCS